MIAGPANNGRMPRADAAAGAGGLDLYEAIGGMEGCAALATAFYARVAEDPLLRPFFPGKSFRCATEALTLLTAQFLGGPLEYSATRWWSSLEQSHGRFKLGAGEGDAWLGCMRAAFEDRQIDPPVRDALLHLFQRSSARIVNQGPRPDPEVPSGAASRPVHPDALRRTDAIMATEAAVAAVLRGEAERALALIDGPELRASLEADRAGFANLLSLLAGTPSGALQAYVRRHLVDDPSLAHARYARGRTLLHRAAALGSAPLADLLLSLGADPNAADDAGHTPLYAAGNEGPADGAEVVPTLLRAGAEVDARDRVMRCTALHMAARRGNGAVATALLDGGADIEAKDRRGDTPLRRAVNCGKTAVAELLLLRGADPQARGSRDLSPVLAAGTEEMRRVLAGTKPTRP